MNDDASRAPEPSGALDPAVPFDERYLPQARVSDELLHAGRDPRPGRGQREDGWTPERIRTFLHTLAACGVVTDAANAAGMSVRSAYYLRGRAEGGPFDIAWNAAQMLARRRLTDAVHSRAIHGCVDVVFRDGEVVAERHRFDNRLTMQVLTRLDRQACANDDDSRASRFVLQEFDEFVDIVSRGGTGAAEFIAARERSETRPAANDAARNLERLENFWRYGAGLPPEEPVPDTESEDPLDRSTPLEEADNAEVLRRYYRWKGEDAVIESGKTNDASAAPAKATKPRTRKPQKPKSKSAAASKPKATRKAAAAKEPAPDPEALRRYFRWKTDPETP